MFEALELHKKIGKDQFQKEEQELRTELLNAQYRIKDSRTSIVVIISGVEGAGKSEVVNRLNEWLDTRWIRNHAFWDESDEETQRPFHWRFWRTFPPRGSTAVLFGSWYTRPIICHALGKWSEAELDAEMTHIKELERMLTDDGSIVVKLWFHLSREVQQSRIKDKKRRGGAKLAKKFGKSYGAFAATSERAIRLTNSGYAPWHLIDAEDRRYRDLKAGNIVLQAMREALSSAGRKKPGAKRTAQRSLTGKTVLDEVNLKRTLTQEKYKKQLKQYQRALSTLVWKARNEHRSIVAVFEGWDAAGKGGAIRRVTGSLDARLYSVISVAAPTDEELARHYLWRFWRHVPRDGYVTIYDRSWYGRVLVERVEGFATEEEWSRSYQEINDFEEHLTRHGTILTKFWVHIAKDEQLRRFKEREKTPWKQHKITDEDWRNREKWDDYAQAVHDMVTQTSTTSAPWILVPGNDKKVARVTIVKSLCEQLEKSLK